MLSCSSRRSADCAGVGAGRRRHRVRPRPTRSCGAGCGGAALLARVVPPRVGGDRAGDRQQPGAEARRLGHLPDAAPGDEERFLDEVLGAVAVGGVEVGAGVDEPRGAADELLERGAVPPWAAPHEQFVRRRRWRVVVAVAAAVGASWVTPLLPVTEKGNVRRAPAPQLRPSRIRAGLHVAATR